jgi:hypothetical protein
MCRYLATSISGFVQQLAVSYLPHGYWFYVTGLVASTFSWLVASTLSCHHALL